MPFINFVSKYYFYILFFLLIVSFFHFGTYRNWPYKVEADGKYYYQYLVSSIQDYDLDFSNNYRYDKYHWMVMDIDHYNLRNEINEITKKPINYWTIGPAILWFPFYVAASSFAKFLMFFNTYVDINPFGQYMQYATMFSAIIYTIISLLLLHNIIKSYFSENSSKLSLWLILFTTPLYYYTIFEPSLSHVYDFFTFTLLLFITLKFKDDRSTFYYVLLGLSGALHILVRTQNVLTVAILFALIFIQSVRSKGINSSVVAKYFALCVSTAFAISPILLINFYLYGSPFTIPQGDGFLNWFNPQFFSLLFSERNGLFSHHPIFLVGIIGFIISLFKNKYDNKILFSGLLLVLMTQIYINSIVVDWWSGHSFGQRRLLFSLPIFAFGISYIIDTILLFNNKYYSTFLLFTTSISTLLWFYLTMIHVFIWDYNKPHNIYMWMFHYAPDKLLKYWGFL